MTRILPVEARVIYSEGTDRAGKVLARFEHTGAEFWSCAQEALEWIAREGVLPHHIGYLKVGVLVEFADGAKYEGRCDLRYPTLPNNDCDLSRHIVEFCCYMAGRWHPARMTEKQYREALALYPETERVAWGRWLDEYALTDAQIRAIVAPPVGRRVSSGRR